MKIQINRSILSSFLYFQAFPSASIYVFLHFFPYNFPYERFNKGKTILSTNKGYYSLLSVIPDFIKSLPRRAKYTLRTNLRFVLWVFRPLSKSRYLRKRTFSSSENFSILSLPLSYRLYISHKLMIPRTKTHLQLYRAILVHFLHLQKHLNC